MNKRKAKKKYKNLYLNKLASSPIVIDITGETLHFCRNREIVIIDRRYNQKTTLIVNIDNVGVIDLNARNPYALSSSLLELDGYIKGYKIENI
jgi:transposase